MARWFVDRLPQRGIPSVSLRRLLPEARFVGCHDWEVSGCTADSRRLDPGQVFVAVRGSRHDGHAFVAQALERGAAGVVVERLCPEAGRLQVLVPEAAELKVVKKTEVAELRLGPRANVASKQADRRPIMAP